MRWRWFSKSLKRKTFLAPFSDFSSPLWDRKICKFQKSKTGKPCACFRLRVRKRVGKELFIPPKDFSSRKRRLYFRWRFQIAFFCYQIFPFFLFFFKSLFCFQLSVLTNKSEQIKSRRCACVGSLCFPPHFFTSLLRDWTSCWGGLLEGWDEKQLFFRLTNFSICLQGS